MTAPHGPRHPLPASPTGSPGPWGTVARVLVLLALFGVLAWGARHAWPEALDRFRLIGSR
jgi:hypothetical protein